MRDLWQEMIDLKVVGWKIFEAYTRQLLASGTQIELRGRDYVGIPERRGRSLVNFPPLGGCYEIRLVDNIVDHVTKDTNALVLFHSLNPTNRLIDFMSHDENAIFHAFQATIGETRTVNIDELLKLEQDVGAGKYLNLYYVVPNSRFSTFVTRPAKPAHTALECKIWHLRIFPPLGGVI